MLIRLNSPRFESKRVSRQQLFKFLVLGRGSRKTPFSIGVLFGSPRGEALRGAGESGKIELSSKTNLGSYLLELMLDRVSFLKEFLIITGDLIHLCEKLIFRGKPANLFLQFFKLSLCDVVLSKILSHCINDLFSESFEILFRGEGFLQ